jgi:hypothetical protein
MRLVVTCCRRRMCVTSVLLVVFAAGCGGRDPILDAGGGVGEAPPTPTVTAVDPMNNAVGVPINESIQATFSEAMAPINGAASITVTCEAPCVNPTGVVTLDTTNTNAAFTLGAGETLSAGTLYTRDDHRSYQSEQRRPTGKSLCMAIQDRRNGGQ